MPSRSRARFEPTSYGDVERVIARLQAGEADPYTPAEGFGFDRRASFYAGPQEQRQGSGPEAGMNDVLAPAELGATGYAAQNGIRARQVRRAYDDAAALLTNGDARTALKVRARELSPAPQRAHVRLKRPGLDAPVGSGGTVNRTNAEWTALAKKWARFGRGVGAVNAVLGLTEIATAKDKPRSTAGVAGATVGGMGGGIAGAEAGMALGSLAGPGGALIGAGIGGVAGSIGGGVGGDYGGRAIYDQTKTHRGGPRR